jgi:hypothetical protein
MSGLRRLALVVVVVAGGVSVFFAVDRGRRATEQTNSPYELGEMVDSLHEPIGPTGVPADIREAERSRRAQRPADPNRKTSGLTYDVVWEGWDNGSSRPAKPAQPMPPTSCRSVEPVPKHASNVSGPYRVHDLTVSMFESASGFGFVRMAVYKNERGISVPARVIDRVELVGLLTGSEPSVYVLDEMATPPLARQAKRRPLDEFERLGLDAVRRGEHLVYAREAPTRMFGAIRARTHCLECHANAKKGDLLGAFTYYLKTPVDQLAKRPLE